MAEHGEAGAPLRDALRWAVGRLRAAGIPNAAREAWILAELATGWSQAALVRDLPSLRGRARQRFVGLVERRAAREPMAYLVGEQEFCGLRLRVSPAVLVPRPETETLVAVALARVPKASGLVVDVGTGSGAVACALCAYGWPGWRIVGVDIDPAALQVAESNRRRLGLGPIRFIYSDLLENVPGPLLGVVANLPYVGVRDPVDPEVHYEPPMAVYAGPDGLDVVRRLVPAARQRLARGGVIALEVGRGQADTVLALLARHGFSATLAEADGLGILRVVSGVSA